jgi:uncharacterized metal-binding protein
MCIRGRAAIMRVVTYRVGETLTTVIIYRSARGRWKVLRSVWYPFWEGR